jgi:hypothetical protein
VQEEGQDRRFAPLRDEAEECSDLLGKRAELLRQATDGYLDE